MRNLDTSCNKIGVKSIETLENFGFFYHIEEKRTMKYQ